MNCEYLIREETHRDERGEHTAFGIEVRAESGACLSYLPSLFFVREKAESFRDLCNRLSLSPEHLFEIAEDILAE